MNSAEKILRKKLKKIRKAYNKKFKFLKKYDFNFFENYLPHFVAQLEYMRDVYFLLGSYFSAINEKNEFSEISANINKAIDEWNAYNITFYKYYAISNKNELIQLVDGDAKEVLELYYKEKTLHYTNFCKIVLKNIIDWTGYNTEQIVLKDDN